MTSSPTRRRASVSVRTVVVFPVPPFWDMTAIVVPKRAKIHTRFGKWSAPHRRKRG